MVQDARLEVYKSTRILRVRGQPRRNRRQCKNCHHAEIEEICVLFQIN